MLILLEARAAEASQCVPSSEVTRQPTPGACCLSVQMHVVCWTQGSEAQMRVMCQSSSLKRRCYVQLIVKRENRANLIHRVKELPGEVLVQIEDVPADQVNTALPTHTFATGTPVNTPYLVAWYYFTVRISFPRGAPSRANRDCCSA